ncbi:unnamed protein product [Clonostachys rosea]|uniref:Uncharacterized protein n=1 Tax=Bionectria ochroleuca TaxID=29856 RepID=A0ABY6TN95_BIOOC|nr:unnamed protein product [Clonostachys rosea]
MSDRGTLIPEHYVHTVPTAEEIELSCIIWGLSLGISVYGAFAAGKQTFKAWKRAKKVTTYMVLIWLAWIASTVMGIVSWAFLKGSIKPGLEYFLVILISWFFQIHTLFQIIVNRIAVLSVRSKTIFRLKWGVFFLTCLINISVACIWVPASLQINETFISVNNVWDRLEKAIICVMDTGLNLYFIYLVRSRLIANGLTKYDLLFKFNLAMIFVSVSLDILIVAMMSLPNKFVYLQFHPVAYLLKLQIELGMADLIVKIVKASNPTSHSSGPYNRPGDTLGLNAQSHTAGSRADPWGKPQQRTRIEGGADEEAMEMEMYGKGIKKTVVTEIVTQDDRSVSRQDDAAIENDRASHSSSTRQLKDSSRQSH